MRLSARIIRLFLVTLLLISPMIVNPYLFPKQSTTLNASPISPIPKVANAQFIQTSPNQNNQSQFALLIAQAPGSKILTAKTTQAAESKSFQSSLSGSYTIAVLGDSMIDVMQPDLPQLAQALQKFYPQAEFKLLNYGVGASNIEYGLTRLTSEYNYLSRHFPPLLAQNPNIIIVESFAYNHWENSQASLDRQWLALAKIVETIKSQSQAKILLAATIGPNEASLCDGIDGINLSFEQKREKAETIRAYLQNLINFAHSQNYPLADAYHASLDKNGNGQAVYINPDDHLHPSGLGGELLTQKIAGAIYKNNLLF